MINAITKGIFFLITKMFNLIFTPIFALISSLFPDLSVAFSSVSYYLNLGLTYVSSILRLLMIDRSALIVLFNYFITMYTIYIAMLTVRFAINIYNKFKL